MADGSDVLLCIYSYGEHKPDASKHKCVVMSCERSFITINFNPYVVMFLDVFFFHCLNYAQI